MEHELLSSGGQIYHARTWWSPKKKKRSTPTCCGELASAKSFEAHVARRCAEFHHFPRVGDCAVGSKQLRGRARAQLRGNIAADVLVVPRILKV